MRTMTHDEARAFLEHGTRTGKLATVRADGRPHVVPVWFIFDGDDLVFTTWHTRVKTANIRRDGRVSLCVDDEKPPFAFVVVEGTATLAEVSPDEKVALTTRIAARYMGTERAEEYGRRNGVEGEFVVRLTPTRFIAQDDIAG